MSQSFAINVADLKRLDTSGLVARKLSEEESAKFKEIIERAKNPPQIDPMQADNHPSKRYAEIVKDGQVIGTVYKGGTCVTTNAIGAKLRSLFEQTDDRDLRAAAIAKATGGTIRYL